MGLGGTRSPPDRPYRRAPEPLRTRRCPNRSGTRIGTRGQGSRVLPRRRPPWTEGWLPTWMTPKPPAWGRSPPRSRGERSVWSRSRSLAAFPRGSITTIANARVRETPAAATAPPRDAGPGKRSQRAERRRRNRFQRIEEELIEELQTLSAGQQPAPEAHPQPTSMAVLHQVYPAVGEAVPTLLQAIGEPVDPPLAPSLEPRGASLPAGGRARSRSPSNVGGRRQGEEFLRNVHVRGLSTPSLVQTQARAGQISS